MAAPKLPNIGQHGGPCTDKHCVHIGCHSIRQLAHTSCAYCGRPIGYDTGFYILGEGAVAHSQCHKRQPG